MSQFLKHFNHVWYSKVPIWGVHEVKSWRRRRDVDDWERVQPKLGYLFSVIYFKKISEFHSHWRSPSADNLMKLVSQIGKHKITGGADNKGQITRRMWMKRNFINCLFKQKNVNNKKMQYEKKGYDIFLSPKSKVWTKRMIMRSQYLMAI